MNNNFTSSWSDDDILFLKENYQNMTHAEMANAIGRTKTAVDLKLSRLGLKKSKYSYDVDYFKNINSEEKAYWLGFIYADGYIQDTYRNYELGIELKAADYMHLKKFNNSINGNVDVKFRKREVQWDDYDGVFEYNMCLIRIYSKAFVEHLRKFNLSNGKSHSIKFPEIDELLIPAFIRGFFDGDGCIYLDNPQQVHAFNFTCASLSFLKELRKLLYKNNINSYICEDKPGVYRLYIKGMTNAYLFGKYLYDDANIYLDRKYEKFHEITDNYNIIERIKNNRNKKKSS